MSHDLPRGRDTPGGADGPAGAGTPETEPPIWHARSAPTPAQLWQSPSGRSETTATGAPWLPDLLVGVAVGLVGVFDALQMGFFEPAVLLVRLVVALGMGAAAGCFRRAPGIALLLVWLSCGLQVASGIDVLTVQLAAMLVAFGTARYGSTSLLWVSGLSIPAGSLVVLAYELVHGYSGYSALGVGPTAVPARILVDRTGSAVAVGLLGLTLLTVPWLLGLLLRSRESAARSRGDQVVAEADRASAEAARAQAEEARAQAEEVARLREQQSRLARDVHDVVGHSLAVILAQAESAKYLPADDPERLQQTMATIATSARQSLRDVRQVLAGTEDTAPIAAQPRTLDSLVAGVRATGHDVRSTVVGTPQPLPPELDVVAYRVLQEMLTNALRHGRRDSPVLVEQHWEGELRLEVRNRVDESTGDAGHHGQGLDGMRRRLESVGGRCDVRRRDEPDTGPTFTTTAWLPVRAQQGRP